MSASISSNCKSTRRSSHKLKLACLLCSTVTSSAFQSASSASARALANSHLIGIGEPCHPRRAASLSSLHAQLQSATTQQPSSSEQSSFQQLQLETLQRIVLPSLLAAFTSTLLFPPLALLLSRLINDAASFAVLSVDSSQFVQNFLTVTGLTFSILVGQTYYFMYQQQESVFNSLFCEVTEAKSLVEQVALLCQGRREMYSVCLQAVRR